MANKEHLNILEKGVETWNRWKVSDDKTKRDLSGANLKGANLKGANLNRVNLSRADLSGANLKGANLNRVNLSRADLSKANLMANLYMANRIKADLSGANLQGARLIGADLSGANLSGANLHGTMLIDATLGGANLERATLVETDVSGAILTDCKIYGISAWAVKLDDVKEQWNLRLTPTDEPKITVDNLEVAQFVYLLLRNENIRNIIDTIGEKGVLILGRFTEERKAVLDAIRKRLRELGFVPIMFDFERPTQRDFTETIKTLAGISRFIIADITNPKSSPLELQATVPDYMIPFVPIIQENEEPFAMFRDLKQKYGEWVLDLLEYDSAVGLLDVLDEAVIRPAIEKADELVLRKAEAITKRHVSEYRIDAEDV